MAFTDNLASLDDGLEDFLADISFDDDGPTELERDGKRVKQITTEEDDDTSLNILLHVEEEKSTDDLSDDNPLSDITTLLARELDKLSIKDQQKIVNDIHGLQENDSQETLTMIEQNLQALQKEIENISDKEAYTQAEEANFQYCHNREFRLMFLRADHFNAQGAARRMVDFFELKKQIFGVGALGRDISLHDDFDEADMATLKAGSLQMLHTRDRAGRAVLCNFMQHQQYETEINVLKTIYYTIMKALEDEITQKNGMVVIIYNIGPIFNGKFDRSLVQKASGCVDILPMKSVSHLCFNDPRFRIFTMLSKLVQKSDTRLRTRFHEGSHIECQYKLMTFGINTNVFPLSRESHLSVDDHLKWIEMQQLQEDELRHQKQNGKSLDKVQYLWLPSLNDVLFGRGKRVQNHIGNMQLRSILEKYQERYDATRKKLKPQIAAEVIAVIQKGGGRFLQKEKFGWREVSQEVALRKVLHTFRSLRSASTVEEKKT